MIRLRESNQLENKLLERFNQVRSKTEDLCYPLREEDYILSVTEDTSPPKWHLAHTTWFFEEFFLKKYVPGYKVFDERYSFLFNSYYKRLGEYLPKSKRSSLSRPSVKEVFEYRYHVTQKVLENAASHDEGWDIIEIGLHHEQQHQELLLMDIKRNFFDNPLRPSYNRTELAVVSLRLETKWVSHVEGLYKIGVEKDSPLFAYDNEKDSHQVWVDGFDLSSHLVTNGDFLSFIEEGGYENPLLWLSDGWDVKTKEGWTAPLYWEKKLGFWQSMTLSGMKSLDLNAPLCHVSYYEAQAYAHWKGCRLPTEQEWEVAALREKIQGHFLEDEHYDPRPEMKSSSNYQQLHGTLWEWTQSAYLPYPRFKSIGHGLSEYNEKFMCNQMILRGGSCLTPKSHYRPTYRNFYYPHMRWQYAGLRLAKDHL